MINANEDQDGLGKRYRYPTYFGFVLVIGCLIASIVTILSACRPLSKYWQIYPDPGSKPISPCISSGLR